MLAFGIDLAGYTTGKSTLAVVEIERRTAKATLLRDSALSEKRSTCDELDPILDAEVKVLDRCLAIGPVAVDVPIDLQGLPSPENPTRVWQLTLRPVDRIVGAMPALADRIGAPTARFAAIMRRGNFESRLGERLFEAYPAGMLKRMNIEVGSYKGPSGAKGLALLCEALKVSPLVENDDDVDAIICALTAAAAPDEVCVEADFKPPCRLPKGFRLPKVLGLDEIRVTDPAPFDVWIRQHKPLQ